MIFLGSSPVTYSCQKQMEEETKATAMNDKGTGVQQADEKGLWS